MSLITLEDLSAHIQQGITKADSIEWANAAINDASGLVLTYCERLDEPWDATTVPAGVALVVKRVASRLFTNPMQRTNYTGPEGLNYSGGPVRLLTDDEREALNAFKSSMKQSASVRMSFAPYLVNKA